MIAYRWMTVEQVSQLKEIDRSEHIDLIYEMQQGALSAIQRDHECPNWNDELLSEIEARYVMELQKGGAAVGAFDGDTLVGFGVLAHRFRGQAQDQLQLDLMFVSRNYRRQGIGSRILSDLKEKAKERGARSLYISSTETRSAVSFYMSNGSRITDEVDEELFEKEPMDIHMIQEL
ncbi:GNAT family N-acetyltransferase [Paenibacillus rhizovicinus]|uniref:GNAT family N-acetyltransferase n=1 Tax=Paenibacillus rhizovicinus TaxID=2704463 RepID=A0A6C0P195_9BACL|nr:GNAT family N-acetyltransferase [Paenibacillus rhizovicinus]QHW31673.1 GNAT family N-acetyltransferase [Paenibacillus rhizovicinus]